MLRVISGKIKGRKLLVAKASRPITDRIRTSIFDTLKPVIKGARVLDLYAGSGAFSIEALSRGADFAVLVENDLGAATIIKQNLIATKLIEYSNLIRMAVSSFLKSSQNDRFDIIMIDPPFALPMNKKIEDVVNAASLLSKEGVIVFRFPAKERYDAIIPGLSCVYSKNMGISCINYYRSVLK